MDSLWVWVSSLVFMRFHYELPTDIICQQNHPIFAITQGGLIEWLILSSWCRRQGLGAIHISNRKRVLFFSKPKLFWKLLFRRTSFAELFLSEENGPRLFFCKPQERKTLFIPTPAELMLAELFDTAIVKHKTNELVIHPALIIWRKHMRTDGRGLQELLFGLTSAPNLFGKLWYLFRKRFDSTVKSLPHFFPLEKGEALDHDEEGLEESPVRLKAKHTRRRILVAINQETRVMLGPRFASPLVVKETLMRDPELQKIIREVAEKNGEDVKKVMSRAYQIFTELVANYRYRFIELMYWFLKWIFTKVFDGIEVQEEEIHRIREWMKVKPVVFIPCHRSHMDYLVIPYLLFLHDMVTPHSAAGINLAFWPVGPFLRMGGAFFIRRSFRGDILYSTCLKKYVSFLLSHRTNIEFFIEGTRSRTGKMLPPAYGFLKTVLEVYEHKACDDIVLVPVSLCYDEVPEQSTYQKELAGAQKEKESAGQLIRSRKILEKNIGKVYVRFSNPLFAKEIYESTPESQQNLLVEKTAFEICKRINDVSTITAKSILATVLLCHPKKSLSLEEILTDAIYLHRLFRWLASPLSIETEAELRRGVEAGLKKLLKSSLIDGSESGPKRYSSNGKKRLALNFYKNNALHALVVPAIGLISRQVASSGEDWKFHARKLRNFLKFDFFFSPTQTFFNEVESGLKFFLEEEKINPELEAFSQTISRSLGEILESYLTLFESLEDPFLMNKQTEKKQLMQRVLSLAEQKEKNGLIHFPESISTQNYSNGLMLLENMKFVKITKDKDKSWVEVFQFEDAMLNAIADLQLYLSVLQGQE